MGALLNGACLHLKLRDKDEAIRVFKSSSPGTSSGVSPYRIGRCKTNA
jgi:hypothetical protein